MTHSVLNKAGQLRVVRRGQPVNRLEDLYHMLLDIRWRWLCLWAFLFYLLVSAVFAALYLLGGDVIDGARPGSFPDAFFFSVQTFSTIGYGTMSPVGTYANTLVTVEAFSGLAFSALAAGLLFAKFSKAGARVVFSNNLVRGPRDGRPSLSLRMANARTHGILEARAKMVLLLNGKTEEGQFIRRFHNLPLVTESTPIFNLSWLVSHNIEKGSVLHELTNEELKDRQAMVVVTVTGLDETLSQTVFARKLYQLEDILDDHRFVDSLVVKEGVAVLDYTTFHEVEPI